MNIDCDFYCACKPDETSELFEIFGLFIFDFVVSTMTAGLARDFYDKTTIIVANIVCLNKIKKNLRN